MTRRAHAAHSLTALAALGTLLSIVCVGVPVVGATLAMTAEPVSPDPALTLPWSDLRVLARTMVIAVSIAVLATLVALPAAWLMRRRPTITLPLLIVPLVLPSYLIYAAWGTLRGPGTPLGNWLSGVAAGDTFRLIDTLQATLGLALWSWPIAALIIGASAARIDRDVLDALRLSSAAPHQRVLAVLALLRPALLAAIGLIALLMLGSAIPLHVARVDTYAIVIWRALVESSNAAAAWRAATPLLLIAIAAGWLISARLLAPRSLFAQIGGDTAPSPRAGLPALTLIIWAFSVLAPLVILFLALKQPHSLVAFWITAGPSLRHSASVAAIVGVVAVIIALSSAAGFSSTRGSAAHRLTRWALRLWIIAALIPGVLIGSGVLRAGGLPGLEFLAATDSGLVLSHLARFGAIAALAGWWIARMEPAELADVRELTAPGLRAWWAGPGRLNAPALLGAAAAVAILSLHEIEATVVVAPPRPVTVGGTLAEHMLRLLHFNRDEELTAAAITMLILGMALSLLPALGAAATHLRWSRLRRAAAAVMPALAIILLLGCDRRPTTGTPLPEPVVIGETGRAPGQFVVPRGIDSDGHSLWVVDKSGRVQQLDPEGRPLASVVLPKFDRGFPTGITCGPDGLIYVPDTHESRILIYRPMGNTVELVASFGEFGTGPAQFIYPTDVAIAPGTDGRTPARFYVSEYGGNERISAFAHDHSFLFSFGTEGPSASPSDIQFRRPQSIAFDATRRELVVTDAVNHRVGRFTEDGALIAWIGTLDQTPGSALGQFAYPYGLALLADGTALVSEFGNNRIQHVDLVRGIGLRTFGVSGREPGELANPWGIAVIGDTAFALDTRNGRIQSFPLPFNNRLSMRAAAPSGGAAR